MVYAETFAKMFCKCFATFLQLQNIFRDGYMQNKTLKHLQNICRVFLEVVTCKIKH